jgi:endonuclease-8
MPEGDSIHRVARRLQVLVGERVSADSPHPRAVALGVASRLDGLRLERVDAVGKNLLLRFEGGVTLRSHLRMSGRWRVQPLGTALRGRPWLVLRGRKHEAVQWNGPVLELRPDVVSRLGPDILAEPPDLPGMLVRLRREQGLPLGEAVQRQELVSGIGNMWAAEALWAVRLSPWLHVSDVDDVALEALLEQAHVSMSAALAGSRTPRRAYRRAGRPCRRCGTPILSRGLGEANRTAYWCPDCQPGSVSG